MELIEILIYYWKDIDWLINLLFIKVHKYKKLIKCLYFVINSAIIIKLLILPIQRDKIF